MDIASLLGVFLLVWLFLVVLMIASMWKIFSKAGQPGWAAIVPIYNIVVILEIVRKPIWWILFLIIPFVNMVVALVLIYQLAKVFGKGIGFTLGLIFLQIIFYPILAFGNSTYLGGVQTMPVAPTI